MFNNKKNIIGVSAFVILLGGWFAFQKILIVLKKNTCEKEGGAWHGTSCQKLVTRQEEEKACVDKGNIWNGKSCEKKKVRLSASGGNTTGQHTAVGLNWSAYQGIMNWEDAKAKCAGLGMRLPTKDELVALCNSGASWGNAGCSDSDCAYWSSTEYSAERAYFVHMGIGGEGGVYHKDQINLDVRCVLSP